MSDDLTGSVAVVAGGARGIGRAVALRLADLGAKVAVLDVNLEAAAEFDEALTAPSVEDELRERAGDGLALQVDLTDATATEAAFRTITDRWSKLDILVVTAGGAITPYPTTEASKASPEDYAKLMAVNVDSLVNCCRAAAPTMKQTGGGSIVTLASGAGFRVAAGGFLAGYGMSKAAVLHYSRHLAAELGPWGIRVNIIAPGVIRTSRVLAQTKVSGFIADEEALKAIPMRRQGEPSDIADAVQLLVSPLSAFITGQLIAVDGGASVV